MKNWNDLRYLLAVKRGGTLSAAARLIGVDDTTVSRRLSALQSSCGTLLWQRLSDGALQLTPEGEAVAHHVEVIEHQIDLIGDICGSEQRSCRGLVRVTSVPYVVNRWLAPATSEVTAAHPDLEIELISANRNFSLLHREADIGLRLARPRTGGSSIKARRIGYLDYSVYAASDLSDAEVKALPWISYQETMGTMPQLQWIEKTAAQLGERLSGITIHDAETAQGAVVSGVGKTILPDIVAQGDPRVRRVVLDDVPEPPGRELWMLVHAEQLQLRRISVVIDWIEALAKRTVRSSRQADGDVSDAEFGGWSLSSA